MPNLIILFTYSILDVNLMVFPPPYFLGISNKAAVNTSEQVWYKYVYISIDDMPQSGILESWDMHVFSFGKH